MYLPTGDDGEPLIPDLSAKLGRLSRLAGGGYSEVFQSYYEGKLVAVKALRAFEHVTISSIKRKIQREAKIWSTLDHSNIVPLLGFVDDDETLMPLGALVSPWCAHGNSETYLSERGDSMDIGERLQLLYGAIEGAIYLHQEEEDKPSIVHGDIKPANILIDQNGIPKLCDFGLSRIFLMQGNSGHTTTTSHTGTARYVAPELVESGGFVLPTCESDVYAMGCVALRFIFLKQPYQNLPHNVYGQITQDILKGVPPATEFPENMSTLEECLVMILQDTWLRDPENRPTMTDLRYMLKCTEDSNRPRLDPSENGSDTVEEPESCSEEEASTEEEEKEEEKEEEEKEEEEKEEEEKEEEEEEEEEATTSVQARPPSAQPRPPSAQPRPSRSDHREQNRPRLHPIIGKVVESFFDHMVREPIVNAMRELDAGLAQEPFASFQGFRPLKRSREEEEEIKPNVRPRHDVHW
ncbi:kinase-like protein [Serendipita vermifera]|nr:kinase-like protein [Serendipita vermifera]